jgi:hypothetical protein
MIHRAGSHPSRHADVTVRRAGNERRGRGYHGGAMRRVGLLLAVFLAACGAERGGLPEPARGVARPWPESVRLAVGASFSCAIDADGSVWCWGDLPAEAGARLLDEPIRAPHRVAGLERVHELAADADTLCARSSGRTVKCWGPAVRGSNARPTELAELRGASAIAVVAGRVCGLVERRLVCVGPHTAPRHDALPEDAWLAAVEDAVCVLDGRGPARCAGPRDHALWEVSGSMGAVSIASGDGVCVVTRAGQLRCDREARAASDAALQPVEGVANARWVAGAHGAQCVAYDDRIACTEGDAAAGRPRVEREIPLAARGLAVATGRLGWHACALAEHGASCWGAQVAGEVSGRANEPVALVAERPGARGLVLDRDAVVVLGEGGQLERIPLDGGEPSAVGDPSDEVLARPWLDLVRCGVSHEGTTLCGRQAGARLAVLPTLGRGRVIEGFAVLGRPLVAGGAVCAPARRDDVICTDLAERVVTVRDLAHPAGFADRLCGLRGGRVVCVASRALLGGAPGTLAPPGPVFEELAGAPRGVARMHAGADQLFLWLVGGTAAVMGHNGAGQLGLPPSRPLRTAASVPPMPFVDMAFARHASCGWAETGAVWCAGLDDALRPRTLSPLDPLPSAVAGLRADGHDEAPRIERGDGRWVEIPGVRDVRALDLDGRVSCALEASGAIRCWGGDGGGVGPRYVGPVAISLGGSLGG